MSDFSFYFFGYPLKISINKFGKITPNTLVIQFKNTSFLTTSVIKKNNAFKSFNSLNFKVIVLENFFAVNKIPNNYNREEDRNSPFPVLIARLIDRAIRPLFIEKIKDQIQTTINIFSIENILEFKWLSVFATSLNLYLNLSSDYFNPTGAIILHYVDNDWKIFVKENYENTSKLLFISGVKENNSINISTIEYFGIPLSLKEIDRGVERAIIFLKQLIKFQEKIYQKLKPSPHKIELFFFNPMIQTFFNNYKMTILPFSSNLTSYAIRDNRLFHIQNLIKDFTKINKNQITPLEEIEFNFQELYFLLEKTQFIKKIFEDKQRIDLRSFFQTRKLSFTQKPISSLHSSSFVEKGLTQILNFITFSLPDKFKIINTIDEKTKKYFFHSYRFHGFASNELKDFFGFSSRREIGHGQFVENVIALVLPDINDFPYVIRSVTDVLSSDGGTSQISIISNIISLLSVGVKLKELIAGVSVGAIEFENKLQLLLDINAFEDQIGLFDFKVVSSESGIYGLQLDIKKNSGVSWKVLKTGLNLAYKTNLKTIIKIKKIFPKSIQLPSFLKKFKKIIIDVEYFGDFIRLFKSISSYSKYKDLKFYNFLIKKNEIVIFLFDYNYETLDIVIETLKQKSLKIKKIF